jgi:hypothetical protein
VEAGNATNTYTQIPTRLHQTPSKNPKNKITKQKEKCQESCQPEAEVDENVQNWRKN